MKKLLMFASVVMMLGLASCSKNGAIKNEEIQKQKVVITGEFEEESDGTKVIYSGTPTTGYQPSWEVGDVVIGLINPNTTATKVQLTVKSISGNVVTFESDASLSNGDVVSAMYVKGMTDKSVIGSDGKVIVSLNATSNINDLKLVMLAQSTVVSNEIHFTFANEMAIFAVNSISGLDSGATLSSLEIYGNSIVSSAVVNLKDISSGVQKDPNSKIESFKVSSIGGTITSGVCTTPVYVGLIPSEGRDLHFYAKTNNNSIYESSLVNAEKNFAKKKCYYSNRKMAKANVFSVSATKKVIFAPGNLQYSPSTSWRFAENQLTTVGDSYGNRQNGSSVSGLVDLFSFNTTNTSYSSVYVYSANTPTGTEFSDWGNNEISGYRSNYWYTPSSAEWTYMFATRTGGRFAYATVAGVTGVIIFPDNYNTSAYNNVNLSAPTELYQSNVLPTLPNGLAFLPSSGIRLRSSDSAASVSNLSHLLYWSSTYDRHGTVGTGTQNYYLGYALNYTPNEGRANHESSTSDGIAVRLCREL